jgi:transcriptional regulator with XRE-family HTH domain
MGSKTKWSEIKTRRKDTDGVRAGYADARANYELAERVRNLRESRGISQQDLAERMHTTQSVISRLESGGAKPSLTTLERVGAALGADVVIGFSDAVRPTLAARSAGIGLARHVRAGSKLAKRYGKKAVRLAKR